MFSFAVPLAENSNYSTKFAGGSTVILSGVKGQSEFYSQPFYISSKSVGDTEITIKCYDRMTYAECDFPCTDDDFIDSDGNETGMELKTVMNRICDECGFLGYNFHDDDLIDTAGDIPKSMLSGKTCHDVLSSLSEAFCGYWCCKYYSVLPSLMFVPLCGNTDWINTISVQKHEALKNTVRLPSFFTVIMTDGSVTYGDRYDGDNGSAVININTAIASKALRDLIYNRTFMHTYQGWKCDNAIFNTLPDFPPKINFSGEEDTRCANYCTLKISSAGIFASCGNNTVDEGAWTYKNRTRRELEQRYKEGDTWKNTEITKSGGIKYVYVNKNGDKKKYGFDVKDEGVTVYEGDMISEDTANDVTVSDDVDEAGYTVGGVTVVISMVWDGDVLKGYKRIFKNGDDEVIYEDEEDFE